MKNNFLEGSHPKYRPDIDGLRAVAVLSVVIYHAFPELLTGGFIGVDIFFVISGFLISSIIMKSMAVGDFSFRNFYARRIKRIFPALLLVMFSFYIAGWFLFFPDEYAQLGKHLAGGAVFLSNVILFNESGYFDSIAETKPLLHLWSLAIEEQFYILWPVILFFVVRFKKALPGLMIVLFFVSFTINIMLVRTDAVAAFYLPHARFWELLSGSMLAWVTLNKACVTHWLQTRRGAERLLSGFEHYAGLFSALGFILILAGFVLIDKSQKFPGWLALIPVVGAVLIIRAGADKWLNRVVLSNKVLVWFGLISFPLYLWHWPLLAVARLVSGREPDVDIRLLMVGLSVLAAWLTYHFVEKKIRNNKQNTAKIVCSVVLMFMIGTIGGITWINDGIKNRGDVEKYAQKRDDLIRMPSRDNACIEKIGVNKLVVDYCLYNDAGAKETVAIIGDSHAHAAYPGISEYLRKNNVNTILLANSACPPLTGFAIGENEQQKKFCRDRTSQLIDVVEQLPDVKRVFIFTRGPYYINSGRDITKSTATSNAFYIPANDFIIGAQKTINTLAAGRKIFWVTDNPQLRFSATACIARPLINERQDCTQSREEVQAWQQNYLKSLNRLKGITVIESLDAFCPGKTCLSTNEQGRLLYADDHHLSISGSRFLVDHLLKPYLN